MAEIQPLVEEAKKAVGSIKNSTLSEVRALRMPPEVIRDILEGVLCLMGTQVRSKALVYRVPHLIVDLGWG